MSIPAHIAIIMDGNGRWAQKHDLSPIEGHRKGAQVAKQIAQEAMKLGISYLTLYVFSSENWHRPTAWVNDIMDLLRIYLQQEAEKILIDKMRLRVIGDRGRLAPDIQRLIFTLEEKTATNTELTLQIALSYGGRDEIVQAIHRIGNDLLLGNLKLEDVDGSCIENYLYTATIPDPDLLIRTSGEHRISNFLLWQLAYSELLFSSKLWPDFTIEDLKQALTNFSQRQRRYGTSFGDLAK